MSEIVNQTESAPPTDGNQERATLHAILDDLANVRRDTRKAATAGSRLANVAPLSFLLPLLRDKNPIIRFAAVEALRLGDFTFSQATVDTLLSRIDDRQIYIATSAIKALGNKRISDADEELISCLGMEESKIAAAALLALSEIGTAQIDDYVEEFLDSGAPIRIRAAAMVVARRELTEFGKTMLELVDELREDAEIDPDSNSVNHYLTAVRSLILALDALQYRDAVPILRELGIGQIGLRSVSLRTLYHMGEDIVDLACKAHENYPSSNISRLLSEISDDFSDDDAALAKLNQHLNSNRDKLTELGDSFDEGTGVTGEATKVAHTYAIVRLDNGMSAYLPVGEYRWAPTSDLRPFESNLCEHGEYQVMEVDRQRGRIKVSRRRLHPDPLVAFMENRSDHQPIRGRIDGIVNFGLFVELEPEIVGLLHVSRLNLPPDKLPRDRYRVGDQLDVFVEEIDCDRRRIRLELAASH